VVPAQKDPELKPVADALIATQLKDKRFSLDVSNDKLTGVGYGESSDLTAVWTAAVKAASPTLQATPDGLRVDGTASTGKQHLETKLHFKSFMPGKSDADIKAAVSTLLGGLPVEVSTGADAAQVALGAPLTKPDVAMPAALARVKTEGDATLFASAVSLPGIGGGSSRGGTMVVIVIGALILIGLAVAASRKKPA